MDTAKRKLEKVCGISAFVIGCIIDLVFLAVLTSTGNDAYMVVYSLLFVLVHSFLIYFGVQVGLRNTEKNKFGRIFNLIALSFLGAIIYLNSAFIITCVYLMVTVTGVISLLCKNEKVSEVVTNEQIETVENKIKMRKGTKGDGSDFPHNKTLEFCTTLEIQALRDIYYCDVREIYTFRHESKTNFSVNHF